MENQFRKPAGWLGRRTLRSMNRRHSMVTDWGLSHVSIPSHGDILDVGCGGGRTIAKLAAAAESSKVYGLDHSAESVRMAAALNAEMIKAGRVEIREGSVSELPYESDAFDLVTAVETIYFWPDLPADVREVWRVVRPGGSFAVICEIYKGAQTSMARRVEKAMPKTGMTLLTPDEHRDLLEGADFEDVEVFTDALKGWVCAIGWKPLRAS
jgi:ubiquinone/menaquinone biosynthesis C-methylase UbiE